MSTQQGELIFIVILGVLALGGTAAIVGSLIAGRRRKAAAQDSPNHRSRPAPTDPWRRFTTALSAPYGRTERNRNAPVNKLEPDQYYFGYAVTGPLQGPVQPLRRDWGVRDRASAQDLVAGQLDGTVAAVTPYVVERGVDDVTATLTRLGVPQHAIETLTSAVGAAPGAEIGRYDPGLAFDIGRQANLVRWAAAARYLDPGEADHSLDILGAAALVAFDGWEAYGAHYLAGLQASGLRGVGAFKKSVGWLLADPASPWHTQPWPR